LIIRSTFRPPVTAIGLLALIALPASHAQAPAPHLEFEKATVKVHPMAPGMYMIKNYTHGPPFVIPTSNRFTDTAYTQDLIMEAYGISEYQILYLPAWTLSRGGGIVYDVDAQAKGDAPPTPDQLQQMLQALLADRFHMKAHWETKPKLSVNALVVDKNGPKFKAVQRDDQKAAPAGGAGTTLFALAHFLSPNLDAPVVDRTGLPADYYDFDINKLVDFHEVDREADGADPLAAQDYLRTAVQHQLGLRLEPRKESTQVLSVDHIDEPSRN
jgi:uncharacterized protein (TIGR03435 family)